MMKFNDKNLENWQSLNEDADKRKEFNLLFSVISNTSMCIHLRE